MKLTSNTTRVARIALAALLAGCASSLDRQAEQAAAADAGTTLAGLALGAAEANPLGVITLIAKPVMLAYTKTLPKDEQADWNATQASIWGGASINNLCIIGVILTAGTAAPFCPVLGVAWGMQKWSESAMQRELWTICRAERAYWKNDQMPCDFFGPKKNALAANATPSAESSDE